MSEYLEKINKYKNYPHRLSLNDFNLSVTLD